MKPVWAIVVLAALLAGPLTLAGGDAKPFLQIEKGNFWKYEGAENEEKISGKIEVTGIGEDGGLKIKFDGMGALWKEMTWRVTDDFLIWDLMPMTVEGWRVLKFSAGKGDSWTSRMGGMLEDAGIELKSKVVDIEDVRVPAGEFAGCLKVETTFGDDLGGGVQKFCMWWAS